MDREEADISWDQRIAGGVTGGSLRISPRARAGVLPAVWTDST